MASEFSNGISTHPLRRERFSEIPTNINIPVSAGDEEYDDENAVVEVERDALPDDPMELCTLLENENSPRHFWLQIALSYAKHRRVDTAIEIVTIGLARPTLPSQDRLPLLHCLTYLLLERCRSAPLVATGSDIRTKSDFLKLATEVINESSKLDPQSPVGMLARGIYNMITLSAPSADRNSQLDEAFRIFDRVMTQAGKRGNMLALMGKARIQYAKRRYEQALAMYQQVLQKRPDMDPDPRIGIGMCFWQLGFKDDAKQAWERALELDPNSKAAHILMAEYYIHVISTIPEYDPKFAENYKIIIDHTQKAYKLDKTFPMACNTFANHFFAKKGFAQCEALATKATEYSDSPSVTSDAYFILARKFHAEGEHQRALDLYRKSDKARENGYLPAKLGVGQIQILQKDIPTAKLTFEAIVHDFPKCVEAKVLLGTLYANEVLSNIPRTGFIASKDDVTELHKKAIALLEQVRVMWKNRPADPAHETILLTLARLYENEQQAKSLQCLQAVEKIYHDNKKDDEEVVLPLQLINNQAVLHWHLEQHDKAAELFQKALSSIPKYKEFDESLDTDALATTLTFNLARCYEASGNVDEAIRNYEQLLQFHEDYLDANIRLAYLSIRKGGSSLEEGQKRITTLMQTAGDNLEVRALYGWYLGRQRRKPTANIGDDPEQRHYKHTLQQYDKHDRYSLTGMGNIYLQAAREMRRESTEEKEKRRKTYEKAVEFFDKALQLDPKNAYAAQGIAIALIEDKRDLQKGVRILTSVKETIPNDWHAVVNLGHCLAGLEQWSRAIDMYETAIKQFGQARDPHLLTAIGRVYYARGKKESKVDPSRAYDAMKTALDYAKKALELGKENTMFLFNVAFVQSELVHQILLLPESQRTVASMETAGTELDEAVSTFLSLSTHKTPPYPPKDIEARANMCKTTRKQLDRRIATQREYETTHSARLAAARAKREAERAAEIAKEEEKRRAGEERAKKLAEERLRIADEARRYAEEQYAKEKEREERDPEPKRRSGKKGAAGERRRRGSIVTDSEEEAGNDSDASRTSDGGAKRKKKATAAATGATPAKKRKKLTKASAVEKPGKYKSKETIDSEDDLSDEEMAEAEREQEKERELEENGGEADMVGKSFSPLGGKVERKKRVVGDSDDEMDDEEKGVGEGPDQEMADAPTLEEGIEVGSDEE